KHQVGASQEEKSEKSLYQQAAFFFLFPFIHPVSRPVPGKLVPSFLGRGGPPRRVTRFSPHLPLSSFNPVDLFLPSLAYPPGPFPHETFTAFGLFRIFVHPMSCLSRLYLKNPRHMPGGGYHH